MTTLPASDLSIPSTADILALVKDRYDLAVQHDDYAGARQLDRVRVNLDRGARLAWSYGDLLVQSVNTPGQVYSVSGRGCTCPNGQKGRQSSCWHVALHDLLLEMLDTRADTRDMEAERAALEADDGDTPPEMDGVRRALDDAAAVLFDTAGLGQRLAAARARLAA